MSELKAEAVAVSGLALCQKVVADSEKLALDAVAAVKGGKIAEIKGIFKILGDLKDLVADLRLAMPAAKLLGGSDAAELAAEVYASAQKVLAAVQAPH